jgi:hypothetical protein
MSRSHQKKRNTALVYEFLVRYISKSLVEGHQKKSSVALKIIKKHFKPGTQLYKEFRLINSLMKMNDISEHSAASIIQEAKKEARKYDLKTLDREKSLLIRSINHGLNEKMFYDQTVEDYKILASTQTLINDWRSDSPDLERVARYEDQLLKRMVSERSENFDTDLGDQPAGTNRLLMKVMMEKLNEKYSEKLSSEQKDVIRAYVWSTSKDNPEWIQTRLNEVRTNLVTSIDSYIESRSADEYTVGQLTEAKSQLLSEDVNNVDDSTVKGFLLYMKLYDELTKDDNNG